ncbi:MAG: type II 3-dehydroquinate dehydratase [Ketobacter sp.]
MAKLLVLNGPNLNLLGTREPEIYGAQTLDQIHQHLQQFATNQGHQCECLQSNREYELIERIHAAKLDGTAFIIINPGALTHTSIALRDAFIGVGLPFIEVHISNVHARENFRKHSYLADVAAGVIAGLGSQGYELALQAAIKQVTGSNE